jgi:acyl-coenzyme A synthetase/AMP-(fatty) acid ligase
MQPYEHQSLWNAICAAGNLSERFLCGAERTVNLAELGRSTSLHGKAGSLRGRSVLLRTRDLLASALAMIELDGIVRRMVLCTPDLKTEDLRYVAAAVEADAVVCDGTIAEDLSGLGSLVPCGTELEPCTCKREATQATEWVLLTSGTTGVPKMVVHNLQTLGMAVEANVSLDSRRAVWSTFFDIRRYGGLCVLLRALPGGDSMVLSSVVEPAGSFLERAGAHGVTHIGGTPSHWRRTIMSPAARAISPPYLRMSGEIADQAILDRVRDFYQAKVAHAFASTEAGVGFVVNDGLAGFPAAWAGTRHGEVDIKVEDGVLRLRSRRNALRYIGYASDVLGPDGYVDTGDMVELRGDRYYCLGRRDGTINVGGLKIHPEEVEAVLQMHPRVRMAVARARRSSITGALVSAEVVLDKAPGCLEERAKLQEELLHFCSGRLSRYQVPAAIRIVSELPVAATGKIARRGE